MSSSSLRTDLERICREAKAAVGQRDVDALLALITPNPMTEDLLRQSKQEQVESLALMEDFIPDVGTFRFLDLRTQDDELAAYFAWRTSLDGTLEVLGLFFRRVDRVWKIDRSTSTGSPSKGDPEAQARKMIDSDEDFSLSKPEPSPLNADTSISAALSVMGYDHQVSIRINGVSLDVQGGKSESVRLFGGTGPSPYVLKRGPNEIHIQFKKVNAASSSGLTVEIFLDRDEAEYRFESRAATEGARSRSFDIR